MSRSLRVIRVIRVVLLLLAATASTARADRRDEYAQATTIAVVKDTVRGQIRLAPGVLVLRKVLETIDGDRDGVVSLGEQRAYAATVLRDLTLTSDGVRLPLRFVSQKFPDMYLLEEGIGEIIIDFAAPMPAGSGERSLTFANRHQPGISAYRVNALVPQDDDLRIATQERNATRSYYRLAYVQGDAARTTPRRGSVGSLGAVALFMAVGAAIVFGKERRGRQRL